MEAEETVEGLKRKLAAQTNVPEKRQKLLGLKARAGALRDDTRIADLALKPGQKVMLLGQADEAISALERQAEVAPHVQDGARAGQPRSGGWARLGKQAAVAARWVRVPGGRQPPQVAGARRKCLVGRSSA